MPSENDEKLAARLLTMAGNIRPDDITAHYSDAGNLNLRLGILAGQEGSKPLFLIEGTAQALLFLADLLIAQAEDELDCGVQLTASASAFFSHDTEAGLYIHALPCAHQDNDAAATESKPK